MVYSGHPNAQQWQYFSRINYFFSTIFVLPVFSKTYSTILDSSLLKMEDEFLNESNKRKDCSQTICSIDESYLFNTDREVVVFTAFFTGSYQLQRQDWTSIRSRGGPEYKYSQSLHATETGISSGLVVKTLTGNREWLSLVNKPEMLNKQTIFMIVNFKLYSFSSLLVSSQIPTKGSVLSTSPNSI